MSTLKADTIQSTSGGAATLTKQIAPKYFIAFDAEGSGTVDASLNHSSATDNAVGDFTFAFSSAFDSARGKGVFTGHWNTNNDGASQYTSFVRGSNSGHLQGDQALSASNIKIDMMYGSDSASDGAAADWSGFYINVIGDLA